MYFKKLSLQNFRNYQKADFNFSSETTLVIGPNASGKTNLIEAIYLLSMGRSFKAEKDFQMIGFGQDLARVFGETEKAKLEVLIVNNSLKRYLVNGVSKRRLDFVGNLSTVIFSPLDLEIIVDSPFLRRNFLDGVLEQVDREYRAAIIEYTKGIRQRNALLEKAKEEGTRSQKQFEYWDKLLITNGEIITRKRGEFIEFLNHSEKDIFAFIIFYDKSIISEARLWQYKEAEVAAGVTLVGPHRDDFSVHMFDNKRQTTHDVKLFGSRGQQRLAILQLKLLELKFIEEEIKERSVLLLDDIFSELDSEHIHHVLKFIDKQQTIITTTHQEFIPKSLLKKMDVIKLE